jgi:hypothetical protein
MARNRPQLALAPEPLTARDVLRQRHAEWGVSYQAVRAAEDLLERAQADVEAAEQRVATGEEAETRIRAHKVQVLRNGGSSADALPEVLAIARSLHRDAKDQLGDARSVVATLQADVVAARAEYQRIGKTVDLAAQDVIRAEDAPRIAKALQEARETVGRLTMDLDGLASIHVLQNFVGYNPGLVGTPFAVTHGPMIFPADILAALNPQPADLNRLPGMREQRYAEWTTYFRALNEDADALPPDYTNRHMP